MSSQQENNDENYKCGNELLLQLHKQFAENQNHHQGLFVQLLTTIIALFTGFGYVYVNTNSKTDGMSSISEGFSINILFITTIVVEAVLLLLNCIILHQGYCFRRDQHLNMEIRKDKIGNYAKIFDDLYDSDNKKFWNYLPGFYCIFWCAIIIAQIFCIVIIWEHLSEFDYCCIIKYFLILICPIGSFGYYIKTYLKYKNNFVNQIDKKNETILIIKVKIPKRY